MKIFLYLTFICTNIFANEYFAYPKSTVQIQYLKNNFNAKAVFSKKEASFLDDEQLKNTYKFDIKDDQLETIKNNCKGCNIERNHNAYSFNRYEEYQWYLHNTGEVFKRWISDIDINFIQGKKGEDISLVADENSNSKKVRVAIVDSGVDLNHPDLKGQFYENALECKDLKKYNSCLRTNSNRDECHEKYAKIDHNKNGYPLDCNGWNLTGKSNPKTDLTGNANIADNNGHGTHIAGIIGAKDNKIGIKGIIQNVELLPVQVGVASKNSFEDGLPTDNIAKGILYAIKNNAKIINFSLGWRINQDSLLMRKMIKMALEKNIIIVAAAGNDSHDETVYPCSYQGVICVASHDVNGELSSFSNFGAHIDLVAPGNSILSTYPTKLRSKSFTLDTNYEYLSGTSQAAPQVVGVLARLLNKGFSPAVAKAKLLNGTRAKKKSHKWIRNGNLSYKQALVANENRSELVSKAPSLINVSKNKEFKFKVNIFEDTQISITSNELVFTKSKWKLNKSKSDIELISSVNGSELTKKSYFINVSFKSKNFEEVYHLQLNPIMVISTKNKTKDIISFDLSHTKEFEPDLVKVITNYYDDKVDYVAIKSINSRYFIKGILKKDNSYKATEPVRLSDKKSLILNISKVDLKLNGEVNYVITAVDLSTSDKNTFFTVLDKDFVQSEIRITPKNKFLNKMTTLPGRFNWMPLNKRMVPTWIGFGEDPNYTQSSPWEINKANSKAYRMYQLDPIKGLTTIEMKKDFFPTTILFQSQKDISKNQLFFIATNDLGYKKTYGIYKLSSNGIEFLTHVQTKEYFDIFNAKYLPLVNSKKSNAFFHLPSSSGSQKVLALEIDDNSLNVEEFLFKAPKELPLLRVLRVDMKGNAIAQSSNRLISYTADKVKVSQSYTNANRIKHYLLETVMGVVLSQKDTFNLSSYTLLVDTNNNDIREPAKLQSFAADDCMEIEVEKSNNKESLSYFCEKNKKILKIQVSL